MLCVPTYSAVCGGTIWLHQPANSAHQPCCHHLSHRDTPAIDIACPTRYMPCLIYRHYSPSLCDPQISTPTRCGFFIATILSHVPHCCAFPSALNFLTRSSTAYYLRCLSVAARFPSLSLPGPLFRHQHPQLLAAAPP